MSVFLSWTAIHKRVFLLEKVRPVWKEAPGTPSGSPKNLALPGTPSKRLDGFGMDLMDDKMTADDQIDINIRIYI